MAAENVLGNDADTTALDWKEQGNDSYRAGDYRAAIDAYTKAIAADSQSVSFYTNRAAAHFMIKAYEKAIADCKSAIELNPKFIKAYLRAGKAYLAMVSAGWRWNRRERSLPALAVPPPLQGKYTEAADMYTKALIQDPMDANASKVRWLRAVLLPPTARHASPYTRRTGKS